MDATTKKNRIVSLLACIMIGHAPLLVSRLIIPLFDTPLFQTPVTDFSPPLRYFMICLASVMGFILPIAGMIYAPAFLLSCHIMQTGRPDPTFVLFMSLIQSVIMGTLLALYLMRRTERT